MGARRQFIDVTYSFFVALAIALILFLTVHAVQSRPDIAEETRERVGFLLLFPLSIAIITGTIGFGLALLNWREWRLLLLAFLGVGSLLNAILDVSDALTYFVVAVFLAVGMYFALEWFGIRRRRRVSGLGPKGDHQAVSEGEEDVVDAGIICHVVV